MTKHVILEREFDTRLTHSAFQVMAERSDSCLGLYQVGWHQSLLSSDGRKLVCWFDSPDHESLRQVMRRGDISDIWPGQTTRTAIWSGSIHAAADAGRDDLATVNVAVERRFEEAVALADIQAREDAESHCLEMRNVRYLQTFFSADRKRMLCFYSAPDAESVRQAQQQAGMPVESVWAFTRYAENAPAQNTTVDKTLA